MFHDVRAPSQSLLNIMSSPSVKNSRNNYSSGWRLLIHYKDSEEESDFYPPESGQTTSLFFSFFSPGPESEREKIAEKKKWVSGEHG